MVTQNKTSQKGIDLIKKFEGCRLAAYLCPAGIPTIGYGSTRMISGRAVKLDDRVSIELAEAMLRQELLYFEDKVMRFVKSDLNQNEFDSLVSFTYNVGEGNFKKSTLLKKVNTNPNDTTIKFEFLKWNKANIDGVLKELPGLTERRKKESQLYFNEL